MSVNSNHNGDELLKASAKKRREAAGDAFDLHPATRRVLQGEVARTFPKRPASRPFWTGLWPRLAFGSAGLAVIALMLVLLPDSNERRHERASTPAAGEEAADFAAAPKPKTVLREMDVLTRTATPQAAPAPASPARVREEAFAFDDLSAQPAPAMDQLDAGLRMRFSQQAASPPSQPAQAALLTGFDLELVGQRVRVVDQDGSVYEGAIATAAPPMAAPDEPLLQMRSRGSVDPDKVAPPAQRAGGASLVSFSVEGTNQTLKQVIQFRGSLRMPAPLAGQSQFQRQEQLDSQRGGTDAATVSGKVQIEGSDDVLIHAVQSPASRE